MPGLKLFRNTVSAAALLTLTGGIASAQTTIIFHHDLPEDSAQHQGALYFKELVEERTDGAFTVDIYPSNELGDDSQVIQQMQSGAVHAAPIPTAKLSGVEPSMQLADLPFLFPSPEVTYSVLDGEVGDTLLARIGERGLHGVAFWESGFKQFTCNARIDSPDDFAGKNVRVMESRLLMAQFRALDANPIPVAFSETYTALQQGVADCQENPIVSISKMRFHEVQDYMILSDHGYLGTAFLYSKVWFDSLDAETQDILTAAAREAGTRQREISATEGERYLEEIRDAGHVEIYPLADDQRAAFEEAMRPVHEEYADDIGEDLLELAYSEIERLSAE